ncbi:hypothetical protein G7Y89_g9781 [Cudoniella acicularis]|uniref:Zn(2)-C6 fungal-type domain-containing protein n=1 Tax=Cudoniella acicularis TaxID=354080 RepID=A0A8H4RG81_9HELO|nr:hypothetical protein G7Y89_g9781 [Cudoniella acicularis]
MKPSSRASRGCMPCRQRKIKCDQSRPYCQMCIKRSKQCHGYRDEADLMFLDQTETIARRVGQSSKVEQGRNPPNAMTGTSSQNQVPNGFLVPASTWTPTENSALVPSGPGLLESLENPNVSRIQLDIPSSEQALSLFFHQYVGLSDSETPGMNEFLPQFYDQSLPNSCLRHCVAATAYASLANQSKSPAINHKAWESYGRALASVNAALADPVESLKDETLSALFILSMFENISAQQLHIFGIHGSGMDRLLQYRGPERLVNRPRISKAVSDYLQIRNLSLGRRPPEHEILFFRQSNYPLAYRMAQLNISRICCVRADAEGLLAEINGTPPGDGDGLLQRKYDALIALVAEMRTVHDDHFLWTQHAPESWTHISVVNPIPSTLQSPPEIIHTYYNLWTSNFWNLIRSSSILLHLSLLKCLNALSSVPEKLPNRDTLVLEAETTIQTMIRDISATIPFVMANIDREGNPISGPSTGTIFGHSMAQLWLLWHFHIVLVSGRFSPQQERVLRTAIWKIGHEKGIAQALLGSRFKAGRVVECMCTVSKYLCTSGIGKRLTRAVIPAILAEKNPTTMHPISKTKIKRTPTPKPLPISVSDMEIQKR